MKSFQYLFVVILAVILSVGADENTGADVKSSTKAHKSKSAASVPETADPQSNSTASVPAISEQASNGTNSTSPYTSEDSDSNGHGTTMIWLNLGLAIGFTASQSLFVRHI
ncbi:hypothetical protein M3Y97_00984300 [Aphelenchoides bicaudatus]|nr:hypothetical protein M3Y97_00984300 [Aphelenchoides bicaudatus]